MNKARLFIAINIDQETRDSLLSVQDRLKEQTKGNLLRFITPSNLHLTLHFFGNIDKENIKLIIDLMNQVSAKHDLFKYTLKQLGTFPLRGKPKVLWADLIEKGNKLKSLQNDLAAILASNKFEIEDRKFIPHLTLAYVNKHISSQDTLSLKKIINSFKYHPLKNCTVNSIDLVQSELSQNGAKYSLLHQAWLNNN